MIDCGIWSIITPVIQQQYRPVQWLEFRFCLVAARLRRLKIATDQDEGVSEMFVIALWVDDCYY